MYLHIIYRIISRTDLRRTDAQRGLVEEGIRGKYNIYSSNS